MNERKANKSKIFKNIFESKNSRLIKVKLSIDELIIKLREIGIKDKTLKDMIFIFKNYELYYFKNIVNNAIERDFLEKNYKFRPYNFFSKDSVSKYIDSINNNSIPTKIKKKYILNKILFRIRTGLIKVKRLYKCNIKSEIIQGVSIDDIIIFFNKVYKSNNNTLIILYQLCFELGLTFSQLIQIKIHNIKKDFQFISFINEHMKCYRSLSFYSSTLLQFYIQKNSLESKDYLIFPEIKKTRKRRQKLCKILFNSLNKKESIEKNNINGKLLNLLNKAHSRIKLNSFEIEEKNKFFQNIWNNLSIFKFATNKQNKIINDEINNDIDIKEGKEENINNKVINFDSPELFEKNIMNNYFEFSEGNDEKNIIVFNPKFYEDSINIINLN